jgi:Fe-S-cluster-containing hydrogenase component 2
MCGICLDVCPVSAIEEGEGQYVINETCINCGKCKIACPIEAIKGKG